MLHLWASLVAQMVKNLPSMQETLVRFMGREDPLEKGMDTHSSIVAWRTPWTEEPGGLQSIGPQRVGEDWATNTAPLCSATSWWPKFKSPLQIPKVSFFKTEFISVEIILRMSNPMHGGYSALFYSPPGSPVHGILQARIPEWVTIPLSRDLPDPGIEPTSLMSPALAGRFLPLVPLRKPSKSDSSPHPKSSHC